MCVSRGARESHAPAAAAECANGGAAAAGGANEADEGGAVAEGAKLNEVAAAME